MKIFKKNQRKSILFHAVSSYQLLEVLLYKILFFKNCYTVLLLPDFIAQKYPFYKKFRKREFFNKVYLFPYLKIPHTEENRIFKDTEKAYKDTVPADIKSFSEIFAAGTHFYFSLYLIKNKISFTAFEDSAGILSKPYLIYEGLGKTYPVQCYIAEKYGLVQCENKYIKNVICNKSAQSTDVSHKRFIDFSVEDALEKISPKELKKIIKIFIKRKIKRKSKSLLLTQNFAGLGLMSEEEQKDLYKKIKNKFFLNEDIIIKKHPDDKTDYREIFPGSYIIKEIFPSELLPYVFKEKPENIYSVSSTGCENLKKHFNVILLGRDWVEK